MDFMIQLAIILVCLFYGAKKGGMALGLLGGVGLVILVFGFGLPPGKPPVDVIFVKYAMKKFKANVRLLVILGKVFINLIQFMNAINKMYI